ncbi:MAG TPA: SDR family NAD(P)-dependent oxidoreductase [Acidimicrobiia bacterium]|jgi:NAD(P)-dependent dehydrogenase (short-subunit alcohol dehydrogenase family)
MEQIGFDGRTAIVTGGGGGLGRAYAAELARRGARVVVNDLGGGVDGTGSGTGPADAVVAGITAAGGEALANYDSIASPAGGKAVVEAALAAFGSVDIVISNAGILRDRSFAKLTSEELDPVIDVHLGGAFNVSIAAYPVMKEAGYGRFVFTSSGSGLFGNFGQANYAAAKMGLVGLSNVVAIEGAKYGIKSNVIAPIARTRMTEELLGPLAGQVEPAQVMPMVLYLCSERCDLTHRIFTAGGGRYGSIVISTNRGWFAGSGRVPSLEEVEAHLSEITDSSELVTPSNSTEEIMLLASMLASTEGG